MRDAVPGEVGLQVEGSVAITTRERLRLLIRFHLHLLLLRAFLLLRRHHSAEGSAR